MQWASGAARPTRKEAENARIVRPWRSPGRYPDGASSTAGPVGEIRCGISSRAGPPELWLENERTPTEPGGIPPPRRGEKQTVIDFLEAFT